jgi:hypothetical protein
MITYMTVCVLLLIFIRYAFKVFKTSRRKLLELVRLKADTY